MAQFRRAMGLWVFLLPVLVPGNAAAASPHPPLLSLVPPGAHIVAGVEAPPSSQQPNNFVLITHSNTVDLADFFALTGADDTLTIQRIVFVAMADNNRELGGHSLLVQGHFNQQRLFKSATAGGAKAINYRGVGVLEIQPFARERNEFRDVRWFAVLDSGIVIFGTVTAARVELDRYFAHSETDPSLLGKLNRLRSNNQTWCVLSSPIRALSSPAWNNEIRNVLARLNPELAGLSQSGRALEFGVHYGRQVEFEYDLAATSAAANPVEIDSAVRSPAESPLSSSLLPALDMHGNSNALHGVIRVSMHRYKQWLAQIGQTPVAVSEPSSIDERSR